MEQRPSESGLRLEFVAKEALKESRMVLERDVKAAGGTLLLGPSSKNGASETASASEGSTQTSSSRKGAARSSTSSSQTRVKTRSSSTADEASKSAPRNVVTKFEVPSMREHDEHAFLYIVCDVLGLPADLNGVGDNLPFSS